MKRHEFVADHLDDRDYLNEKSCRIADFIQRLFPDGPSCCDNMQQLLYDVCLTAHGLLVLRVKELDQGAKNEQALEEHRDD